MTLHMKNASFVIYRAAHSSKTAAALDVEMAIDDLKEIHRQVQKRQAGPFQSPPYPPHFKQP